MGLAGESLSGSQVRLVLDLDNQSAAWGTAKTTSKKGKILAYNQDTVVPNSALIQSAGITGLRTQTQAAPGNIDVNGNIVVELTYELLPYLMYLCMGGKSASGSETPWTHTLSPGTVLPTFQIERRLLFAAGTKYYVYNGCRVNTWTLDFKASGFVLLTMGVLGGKLTVSDTEYDASAADFRAGTKIHGQQLLAASIKLDNAATAELLDLQLTGNNVLVNDDYAMGSLGYRAGNDVGGLGEIQVKGTLRCLTNATIALLTGDQHTLEWTHQKTVSVLSAAWKLFGVQFSRTHPAVSGPGAIRLAFTGAATMDAGDDVFEVVNICSLDPADIA